MILFIKILFIILICVLSIYAPIELTRVIINWGLFGKFVSEVCFVWFFYALAILLVSLVVFRKFPYIHKRAEK